jgi:hypothetical protein
MCDSSGGPRSHVRTRDEALLSFMGVHDANEMRAAQEAVEAAEDHLWQLREELLGWVRPPWAPSAALTSDWFSDEDAVYDDLPETTSS